MYKQVHYLLNLLSNCYLLRRRFSGKIDPQTSPARKQNCPKKGPAEELEVIVHFKQIHASILFACCYATALKKNRKKGGRCVLF